MLCVGLRDGEDGDLSTMGFTARQSGCLTEEPLDAFLPHFELIRFPREVCFFFFPHYAAWRVKLGCLCSEIPVSGET